MKKNVKLEEKILDFLYNWLRPIRIGDLQKELGKEGWTVHRSSLNSTIERLVNNGHLHWEKYGPISLTKTGQKNAAHSSRHFHLLSMFFMKTLKITPEEAKKECLHIAGTISCTLIDQIAQFLGRPEYCICKKEIPIINECTSYNE